MSYHVYLAADKDGRALYVGMTMHLERRLIEHARLAAWYPDAAQITSVEYATREQAQAQELADIRDMKPLHNAQLRNGKPAHDRSKDPKATKAYSIPRHLAEAVIDAADEEGHGNASQLVAQALTEYLTAHHPEIAARLATQPNNARTNRRFAR